MRRFENKNDYERVRRLNGKQVAAIAFNFLWMLGVYYGCIVLSERLDNLLPYQICTSLYVIAIIFLGAISCIYTGKLVSPKTGEARTKEQIDKGKQLLLFVLPLIAVLLIDFIDLFVVEYIKRLFSVV